MSEVTATLNSPATTSVRRGVWRSLRRRVMFWVCLAILTVLASIALLPELWVKLGGPGDPRACDLRMSAKAPNAAHPFGTDVQGCDVYANVIFGTRASLTVGIVCTLIALVVALILGTIAGFWGGWADRLISRLTDVFLGFPFLLGAVVVLTTLPERSVMSVALVLALFSWPTMARLVRGSVRAIRGADYVDAARAMGLSTPRILTRYVLPNSIGPVLAVSTIMVGTVIVSEATLTFLGLGLRAPSISWGLQLAAAQERFQVAPHMLLFPSLFLTITVLAMITLGDMLRDTLDPKGR